VPVFGGETEFADLRMAWDDLPDWRQRQVEGLRAVHYALHSRFLLRRATPSHSTGNLALGPNRSPHWPQDTFCRHPCLRDRRHDPG
jgi:alpha-ketoglutarate-dependent 2,4-dichlorophenoxyacetate dioxygenase